MPQYAKADTLLPAAEEMFDMASCPRRTSCRQLLEAVTVDGHMWTVPFDNYGVGVYLNLSLLGEGRLDPAQPPRPGAVAGICDALTWDNERQASRRDGFDAQNRRPPGGGW